jgi:hypothetical protein
MLVRPAGQLWYVTLLFDEHHDLIICGIDYHWYSCMPKYDRLFE